MGMKQILVMMAVVVLVGCGEKAVIADRVVERAVRKSLKKPEGKLTEADLEKVTSLNLGRTQITDEGLKEVAKLQQLAIIDLDFTKVTKTGVAELRKALPNCRFTAP